MVNSATLVGNLGQDPELKTTASGMSVCNLSVATSSRVKKGDEWQEQVEWHRCTLFGKNAENAAKYLQKGRQVYIEGRIHYGKYTDKNGVERYTTDIMVNDIKFLGSNAGGQRRDEPRRQESRGQDTAPNPSESLPFDSDIPF